MVQISIGALIILGVVLAVLGGIDKLEQYHSWKKANKPCSFDEWPHYRIQWEKKQQSVKENITCVPVIKEDEHDRQD